MKESEPFIFFMSDGDIDGGKVQHGWGVTEKFLPIGLIFDISASVCFLKPLIMF